MNEKCPKCGSNMVEKAPGIIYATYPACWDRVLWCACGHTENRGIVRGKTSDEILMDTWREANKSRSSHE